jgi:UDP-N-acetylmuramate dehydrogenase
MRSSGPVLAGPFGNLMTFLDISSDLKSRMPELRGRLLANQPLAELTWFRVGGPAQVLFMPEDETDLAYFLKHLPTEIPVMVIGLGSNLIVRDAGVPGVVIRLGRGFNDVKVEGTRIRAGTAVPDVKVARAAQEAGIAGLSFLRGIPGGIGGALRMNGGAYGGETKDALIEARGGRPAGQHQRLQQCRHALHVPTLRRARRRDFHGGAVRRPAWRPGNDRRRNGENHRVAGGDATIKSRTGGSTFKNPPGNKAWQLIDAAGCRGLAVGDAQVSELHCNFLINRGNATAADIETLGETVRRRVKENSGVTLEWEIKRIGVGA